MELKLALEGIATAEQASDELAREKATLPRLIQAAEDAARSARELIAAERERLEALEAARRDRETAIQDHEAQIDRFQGQTAVVKTNQEYTALLGQIERAKHEISQHEEEILQALEESDRLGESIRQLEEEQGRIAGDHDKQAEAQRTRLAEVERELEFHEQQRRGLVGDLPADLAARYARVFGVRGSGVAVVRKRGCAACHRDVPFETINRIQAGETHLCASCQRILILPDEGA